MAQPQSVQVGKYTMVHMGAGFNINCENTSTYAHGTNALAPSFFFFPASSRYYRVKPQLSVYVPSRTTTALNLDSKTRVPPMSLQSATSRSRARPRQHLRPS